MTVLVVDVAVVHVLEVWLMTFRFYPAGPFAQCYSLGILSTDALAWKITCRSTVALTLPPPIENVYYQSQQDCSAHDNGDLRGQQRKYVRSCVAPNTQPRPIQYCP